MDWTIRKKDTHVQSQENLGGELCTLSLISSIKGIYASPSTVFFKKRRAFKISKV